jgi:hypothetical protein
MKKRESAQRQKRNRRAKRRDDSPGNGASGYLHTISVASMSRIVRNFCAPESGLALVPADCSLERQ